MKVLNSFFLETLRLRFQPRASGSRLRLNKIDTIVSDRSVTDLLIPVHQTAHWVLLHVNLEAKTYSLADSLNPKSCSALSSIIEPLNQWLTFLVRHDIVLIPVPHAFEFGLQEDDHSCGVSVLSSTAHFALGAPFDSWSQLTAKCHRLKWAERFSDPLQFLAPHIDTESEFYQYLDDSEIITSNSPDRTSSFTKDPEPLKPLRSTSSHLIQTKLQFKSIPQEEWRAIGKQQYLDRKVDTENAAKRLKEAALKKQLENRLHERNRKRKYQERQKKARQTTDLSNNGISGAKSANQMDTQDQESISGLTQPYSVINATLDRQEKGEMGLKRKNPFKRTTRVNWAHPLVWPVIQQASDEVGYPWSPTDIVRRSQKLNPAVFASLTPQHISQWRDHCFLDKLKWTKSHQQTIHAGCHPNTGKRHRGIFVSTVPLCA
ncbi:hypothetical protein RSAG8_06882, partial [Rhizoctonia solani AG-8 WAC10335]